MSAGLAPGVVCLIVSCGLSWPVYAQMVTTESLLREMTDLAGMAEFPDPPYTCKQFSSYDRASKSAADAKGLPPRDKPRRRCTGRRSRDGCRCRIARPAR